MEHTTESLMAREFPDYPVADLPAMPEGFECSAWHNDSMPTFHEGASSRSPQAGDLMIAVDYADPSLREFPEGTRYAVLIYWGNCSPESLFDSDNWSQIELAVKFARIVRNLGLGFHPDTSGAMYVNHEDESPCFTDSEALAYDEVMDSLDVDQYALALEVWRAMGLIGANE